MKRGCLRNLVVLAAATALWGLYLLPRFSDEGEGGFLAVCGGLLTSATVWTFWKGAAIRKDVRAIESVQANRPPVDGAWYAAVGELHFLPGAERAAPFSGRPAVAYEYDTTRSKTTPTSKGRQTQCRAYFGSALAPCEIRTTAGPVRLFGMPFLDFEATTAGGPDARRRADDWVSSTAFSETGIPDSLASLKSAADDMAESTDAAGAFRRDYRSEPDATLDGWTLSEKIVPPGQEVCVFGRYSGARGGLEPPPVEAAETLRLLPGDATRALASSADRVGCLRFAVPILVLAQGAIFWFAPSRHESPEATVAEWTPTESDLFRAASDGEPERVRSILGRKTVGPSAQDPIGRTPAHVAANAVTLKVLLDAGALPGVQDEFGVTPLMLAASEGDAPRVRLLLERGAAVDARTRQGVTALSLANQATRKVLEEAGAPSTGPWDGFGSPIPGNGEDQWKVVLAYVEAIEEEDETAYRALLRGDPGDFPSAVAVRGSTPGDLRFLTGHLEADAAVVTGEGRDADGTSLMTVTLERAGGSWKIRGVETTPISRGRSPSAARRAG